MKRINKKGYRIVWVNGDLQIIKRFGGAYEIWLYEGKDELGKPHYSWHGDRDTKAEAIAVCIESINDWKEREGIE